MRIPSIYLSRKRPLRAIRRELRVYRPLPARVDKRKFLVFAQGRTGSTLLCRLLGSHSQVWCDDELLKYPLASPRRFLDRCARIPPEPVYGFHVKGDQLEETQQLDAREFLVERKAQGWRIVHLQRRNLFELALSNQYRRASERHHFAEGEERPRITLEIERIFRSIRNRRARAEREARAIEGLEDERVRYEDDLIGAGPQQRTCDALFRAFGLEPESVSSGLEKSVRDPWTQFANLGEVLDRVAAAGDDERGYVDDFLGRFPKRR